MNDQLEKVIAACLDDLSRCKPAQTESILRQHFAPVVAAVERDRDEYQEMEQVADSFRQQWKLESEFWQRKAEENHNHCCEVLDDLAIAKAHASSVSHEELKDVLWSISLSDHLGDVGQAIKPILKHFGLEEDSMEGLRVQMVKKKLIPEWAKSDFKEAK